MSVVINTNYAATVAANNLSASNTMLQKSLNRLSSGSKIVTPSDDAGGLAVAMKLSAASTRQGATQSVLGNAESYLQTQDGSFQVASKVLDRISELRTYYQDPTKNATDLLNYDKEFTELQSQLTAVANETFNSVKLFGTASYNVIATEDQSTGSQITMAAEDINSTAAGVGVLTAGTVTSLANLTIGQITTAIQNVAAMRAQNGASQNRLGFAGELLTVNKANLEAATSRIMDVDVASESTQLARWNILVQSGTSMLSQANQSSSIALKLLQ
jgi:flagellin